MNISPVNLVNLKSGLIKNKNEQNFKQKNTAATSTISNNKISSETLKAYYCPQISFKGNDDNNDKIQLPEKTVSLLSTSINFITGKRLEIINPELYEKLKNGTASKKELVQLLKIKGKGGNTVSHHIADKTTECGSFADLYYNITKDLPKEDRASLLKMTNNKGRCVANGLMYRTCFSMVMKDIPNKDKLAILKSPYFLPHNKGHNTGYTIAEALVFKPSIYCEITESLPNESKMELFKISYSEGNTNAHVLAKMDPKAFYSATNNLSLDDISALLEMRNEKGQTVADMLPDELKLFIQRKTLESYKLYTGAIRHISPEKKLEILYMSDDFKTAFRECDLKDPIQQKIINQIIMNLMGIGED